MHKMLGDWCKMMLSGGGSKAMKAKRIAILKSMATAGIDLGRIGIKLSLYSIVAAVVFFLFGGYLAYNLPSPMAIALYAVILILVIVIQIVQMIRRDRDQIFYDQLLVDVDFFFRTGQPPAKR